MARAPEDILREQLDRGPMMASAVITQLQTIIRQHGDLPVILSDRDVGLNEIIAYDADGNSTGTPVEIGLHGW